MGTPACIIERNCLVKRIRSEIFTLARLSCILARKEPPLRAFAAAVTLDGMYPFERRAFSAISTESASIVPETFVPFSLIA